MRIEFVAQWFTGVVVHLNGRQTIDGGVHVREHRAARCEFEIDMSL